MKHLLKTLGIAAAFGWLGIIRAAAFELYVFPEPFPQEDQVLLFGDGDPVATRVDEWRSARSLKLDPYENLASARMFSHAASEDGRSGTNFLAVSEPTPSPSSGLKQSDMVKSTFDNAGPATARVAATTVPEPDGLRLALFGGTLVLLRHLRRSTSGCRHRGRTLQP